MNIIKKTFSVFFDISVFKSIFLMASFFYCIPFTNPIMVQVFKLFILWGIVTFIYNFFWNKNFTFKKSDYLMIVFLGLAFVSCLVNYQSNLVQNVISAIYIFISAIMMLPFNSNKNIDEKAKEFKIFSWIAVSLTFVCAVTSILIFLFNFKYSYAIGFQQYVFGVFEGRLWGIQGNPNTLAQFALMSIWLSVALIIMNKHYSGKKGVRIFLYVNIVLEFICCVLSNSRSTSLGTYASAIVFAIWFAVIKIRKSGQSIWQALWKNKITSVLKVAVIICGILLSTLVVKEGMVYCAIPFKSIDMNFLDEYHKDNLNSSNNSSGDSSEPDGTSGNSSNKQPNVSTDREFLTDDYSNGRFEIWKGAAKVIIDNPFFGVGTKNINTHVNNYLSETTVTNTPKLSENMHNIYIQVFVAHGVFAFAIFIIYLIITIIKILKYFFTFKSFNKNDILAFKLVGINAAIIASLLVINLFDSVILYFCLIFLVPIFWNAISMVNSLIDMRPEEKEKKKLLIAVDSLETGGTEKALIDLTDKLNYEKYDIHVKTVYNVGKYINDLDKRIKYSSIIKRPNFFNKRVFYRLVKLLPAKLLYQLTISESYDAEIAFHELLSTKILSGSSSNSLKIAWIHTNMFSNPDNHQMFCSHKAFVKGYDRFDKIICVSQNLRDSFNEKTNLNFKTETIYNPINISGIIDRSQEECDAVKSDDSFLIVTIGRLEKVKGYDKLLDAFCHLNKSHPNTKLWILGEGSERKNFEKFILENGLTDSVKLLGFKSNPYNYLKQADLFISTSEIEGFSLAVAEAIVLGLPIISTSTDGPKEILENGKYGMLINGDPLSIANAIESVITNRETLEELKQKSNARKQYFENLDTVSDFDRLICS